MPTYTKFTREQQRQMLENNLADIERQHYARTLDLEHWRDLAKAELPEAVAVDDRVANNRAEECRSNIAMALYNLTQLELKAKQLRRELDALEKIAPAEKADAAKK